MANYLIDKGGCRLEIDNASVNVRVRFRGSVAIPIQTIQSVDVGHWRSVDTIQITTPLGMYEWSFGDRTLEVVTAVRQAAFGVATSGRL